MKLLETFPRYDSGQGISTVNAGDLTYEIFFSEYIDKLRPCLIKGAVRHWPAFERWQSLDYIRQKIGNPSVKVATKALHEPPRVPANEGSVSDMSFDAFLQRLASSGSEHTVLHGYQLAGKSPLAPLGDDALPFSFLEDPPARPRVYPPIRAFLFKNSYTDWHCHPTDETLMCQVKGAKEVLLLPPDRPTADIMNSIRAATGHCWNVDLERFPEWATMTPYRTTVSAGDALYIPTFWHHAVGSVESDFGWTVACCWATPGHLFDPRLAGVRDILKSSKLNGAGLLAVAAAAWSVLSLKRLGQPPYCV